MRLIKTWRGKPDIMDEDIKRNQELGNMLGGFLGMFFVFAIIMFFYEGCSWEGYESNDQIVSPEEKEEDDPNVIAYESTWTWILFK